MSGGWASGQKGAALARGMRVLESIMQEEAAIAFFNAPVREEDAPGYSEVITNPIDLGTLHAHARAGEAGVTSAEMLRKEVARVWLNCCSFNPPGNPVRDAALSLAHRFDSLWHSEGLKGSTKPSDSSLASLTSGTPPERFELPGPVRKRRRTEGGNDGKAVNAAAVGSGSPSGAAADEFEVLDDDVELPDDGPNVPTTTTRGRAVHRASLAGTDADTEEDDPLANADESSHEAHTATRLSGSSSARRQQQSSMRTAPDEFFGNDEERPQLHSLHSRKRSRGKGAHSSENNRRRAGASGSKPNRGLQLQHVSNAAPAKHQQQEEQSQLNWQSGEQQGLQEKEQQMQQEVDLEELSRNASEPMDTTFTQDVPLGNGNKEMLTRAREILESFRDKPMAFWFRHPVDPSTAPGYEDIVRRPMDLSKILQKIRKGRYKGPLGVLNDATQIWHNCFLYNNRGDSVWEAGAACQKEFLQLWREAGLPDRAPDRNMQSDKHAREDDDSTMANRQAQKKYKNWTELVRLADLKEERARALEHEAVELEHAASIWMSNTDGGPSELQRTEGGVDVDAETEYALVADDEAPLPPEPALLLNAPVLHDTFLRNQVAMPATQPLRDSLVGS